METPVKVFRKLRALELRFERLSNTCLRLCTCSHNTTALRECDACRLYLVVRSLQKEALLRGGPSEGKIVGAAIKHWRTTKQPRIRKLTVEKYNEAKASQQYKTNSSRKVLASLLGVSPKALAAFEDRNNISRT